ncbi:hypothetical protein [Limosilactobacillus reuteri]|uniref:hypothetical protein n=1 Tax=Limosilactobacillus reuteri TaxID=1598 RepID=UPI002684434D|nr:hypothetical protein [Limosilactobacillus reuteri]
MPKLSLVMKIFLEKQNKTITPILKIKPNNLKKYTFMTYTIVKINLNEWAIQIPINKILAISVSNKVPKK